MVKVLNLKSFQVILGHTKVTVIFEFEKVRKCERERKKNNRNQKIKISVKIH